MARRTTRLTVPVDVATYWDRLWTESSWTSATDLVEAVDVLDGGDRHGNGRWRRIHQHRRWWDATLMFERTERVARLRSVDGVVHHHRADLRHGWRLQLTTEGPSTTLVHLDEQVEVDEARYPWESSTLPNRLLDLRPALLEGLGRDHTVPGV